MSAPKWPPPITHHKSTNTARVRHKGRDYSLGPWGSTESHRRYAELLLRLAGAEPPAQSSQAGQPPPAKVWTIAEAVARWAAEESPRYDPVGGEAANMQAALNHLLRVAATKPCADLDAELLETVRQEMRTRNLCAGTINARIGRIRRAWKWIERKKMAPRGSSAGLALLPAIAANDHRYRHQPKRRAATWEELEAVRARCGPVVSAMLLFQWWTGCRSGEVRRARVGEIGTSGEVWLYRPTKHKTSWKGLTRVVMVGPQARAVVEPWLAGKGPEDFVFPSIWGGGWNAGSVLFPRTGSKGYTIHAYARAVRRAANKAGLPGWSAYMCRHAVKQRVAREMGLDAARIYLGHSSISQTAEYSAELDLPTALDVARRLG